MQLAMRHSSLIPRDLRGVSRVDAFLGLGLLTYGALYLSWLVAGRGGADLQLAIADGIFLPLGALVVTIAVRAAWTSRRTSSPSPKGAARSGASASGCSKKPAERSAAGTARHPTGRCGRT